MEIGGQLFGGAIAALGGRDEADLVSLLLRLDQPSRVGRFGSVTSDTTLPPMRAVRWPMPIGLAPPGAFTGSPIWV